MLETLLLFLVDVSHQTWVLESKLGSEFRASEGQQA